MAGYSRATQPNTGTDTRFRPTHAVDLVTIRLSTVSTTKQGIETARGRVTDRPRAVTTGITIRAVGLRGVHVPIESPHGAYRLPTVYGDPERLCPAGCRNRRSRARGVGETPWYSDQLWQLRPRARAILLLSRSVVGQLYNQLSERPSPYLIATRLGPPLDRRRVVQSDSHDTLYGTLSLRREYLVHERRRGRWRDRRNRDCGTSR